MATEVTLKDPVAVPHKYRNRFMRNSGGSATSRRIDGGGGESVDLSSYLTISSADGTYLKKTDAAGTYLAKTDAAQTYLTKEVFDELFEKVEADDGTEYIRAKMTVASDGDLVSMGYAEGEGGGGGSTVAWNQLQATGVKIAQITIDGETVDVYAPTSGGGGGGTTDYSDLTNKPQVNGVLLVGNVSLADIGAAAAGHNHNGVYATAGHNHDGVYATAGHNHDGVYAYIEHEHYSYMAEIEASGDTIRGVTVSGGKMNGITVPFATKANFLASAAPDVVTSAGMSFYHGQPTDAIEGSGNDRSKYYYPKDGTYSNGVCTNVMGIRVNFNANYYRDIFMSPNNGDIWHRLVNNGVGEEWRKLIDSSNIGSQNVASADKANQLTTARTLWGRSFNGTADVRGNMTDVGSINDSIKILTHNVNGVSYRQISGIGGNNIEFGGGGLYDDGKTQHYAHCDYYFRGNYSDSGETHSSVYIQESSASHESPAFTNKHYFLHDGKAYHSGYLGIGVEPSTSYRLDVNGIIRTNNDIYMSNDKALRYVVDTVGYNILQFNNNNNDIDGTGNLSLGYGNRANGKTHIYGKQTNIHSGDEIVATLGLIDSSSLYGIRMSAERALRIGNAVLRWDNTNSALYVEGVNGASCGFYATGGLACFSNLSDGTGSPQSLVNLTLSNQLTAQKVSVGDKVTASKASVGELTVSSKVVGDLMVEDNVVADEVSANVGDLTTVNCQDLNVGSGDCTVQDIGVAVSEATSKGTGYIVIKINGQKYQLTAQKID